MDLDAAREVFEASQDLTVGIEEEWGLVDPETLLLVPEFETLRAAAVGDPVLGPSIAGELISSEFEIRSGKGADLADALSRRSSSRRSCSRASQAPPRFPARTGSSPSRAASRVARSI